MTQIEYLTSMLYSQLGITKGVMDGSADEQTMLNYCSGLVSAPFPFAVGSLRFLLRSSSAFGSLDGFNPMTCRIALDDMTGKLDLIIQLPYVIKTEARRAQAEKRRKDIEEQLSGSKYGIAYTDGTEHIVQLNRAVENNDLISGKLVRDFGKLGGRNEFEGISEERDRLQLRPSSFCQELALHLVNDGGENGLDRPVVVVQHEASV